MKYRKKPIVVEAFQMTIERRWDNSEWPEWLNQAWQKNPGDAGCLYISNHQDENDDYLLEIYTLEGIHLVCFGDFIIQGVKGELYPCKPDIFEETYEEVSND